LRRARHIAGIGDVRRAEFWLVSLKGKGNDHLEDLDVYERIILKCTSRKEGGRKWTELIRFVIGTGSGFLGTQ
jgi:hypothetical protein